MDSSGCLHLGFFDPALPALVGGGVLSVEAK